MCTSSQPPLRIAIAGAGIAGLATYLSLTHQYRTNPSLISITLYEQATALHEIGASIALGPNGLRTLKRLGLHDVISDENCFRGPDGRPMIYRHWKTAEVIGWDSHEGEVEGDERTARFHRGHLHGSLLEKVPKDSVVLGKRVQGVEILDGGVRLRFQDGTVAEADLLLGADGLRSAVRQHFVPDFKLQWSGWTAYRTCFPASLTEGIPNLPEDSIHWWGPKTTFFSSKLGRGSYTVVGSINVDPEDPEAQLKDAEWDEKASLQAFRDLFRDWNPIVKALTEVTPSVRLYPNLSCAESLSTWIFANNRVTLIGDAAHAHGGAHATGGSIAIDDAYAFSLALSTIYPPTTTIATEERSKSTEKDLGKALKLYERTRKSHADRLLTMVHGANEKRLEKLRSGKEESDQELRDRARNGSGTAWLHEHDVVGAFEKTLKEFEKEEKNVGGEEVRARL